MNLLFKNNALPLLLIAAFAMGLYIQTLRFDYALDDTMVIVKNEFTKKGISGIPDIFKYESFRGYFGEQKKRLEGDRYRPLSIATFAVEQSLFNSNKAVSHLFNILLYACTGILLFRVLLFMFYFKKEQQLTAHLAVSEKWYFSIPFIATLLFIVHPLHTEVVANIKGRDDILALLGELGALYFTFKYLRYNKIKYLILSFAAFLIGIFSKESALTFLGIIPLTVHFFTETPLREKLKITLPLLTATAVYLFMRLQAIGYLLDEKQVSDLMNNPFYGMTMDEKTATIFYTFLIYLKLLIFPHPLTHDYYPYQIPKVTWSAWQPLLALLLHIGLGAVILRGWKNKTIWAYGAAFYLIALSIVSNLFVSVGTFMNERFLYPASLGFCIVVAYFLNKKLNFTALFDAQRGTTQKAVLATFILVIIGFSAITILRLPDWRNNQTLNESAIKNSPNSARANCFYAISMWENKYTQLPIEVSENQKRTILDSMTFYLNKSVKILPNYGAAHRMRVYVAAEYHKMDGDYAALLKIFEESNLTGVYQPFVIDYLDSLMEQVENHSDAEKLQFYFQKMLEFYKKNYPNTSMPYKYQQYLSDIESKILTLR